MPSRAGTPGARVRLTEKQHAVLRALARAKDRVDVSDLAYLLGTNEDSLRVRLHGLEVHRLVRARLTRENTWTPSRTTYALTTAGAQLVLINHGITATITDTGEHT